MSFMLSEITPKITNATVTDIITVIEPKKLESSDALSPSTQESLKTIQNASSELNLTTNPKFISVDNLNAQYGKPNAIVRPVVRRNETIDEMSMSQSMENNSPVSSVQPTTINRKDVAVKNKKREIDPTAATDVDNKSKAMQKDKRTSLKNVKEYSFISFELIICHC